MKSKISVVERFTFGGGHFVPVVGFAGGSRVATGLEQLKVGRLY